MEFEAKEVITSINGVALKDNRKTWRLKTLL